MKQGIFVYFFTIWGKLLKWFIHSWTKKCEIQRLCEKGWHSWDMSFKVVLSLNKSIQLHAIIKETIHKQTCFETAHMATIIMTKKKIPQTLNIVYLNLTHCLHAVRAIHILSSQMIKLQEELYDTTNKKHIQLLEKFWDCMKPDIRRKGGMISEEWGELGFQGKDPSTDFRGMGVLGLYQLVYFSEYHYTKAQTVLLSSNHIRRYYPFAATGINITSFVLDLLKQKRLYKYLFHKIESGRQTISSNFSQGPSENDELINYLIIALHELYSNLYFEFHQLWEIRDPPDIMSFQEILGEFKFKIHKNFKSLDEY
eukprot:gene7428-15184_t